MFRSKAFTISLITHLLFFAGLLISSLWARFESKEEPTIMQLVDLPSTDIPTIDTPPTQTNSPPPPPSIELPTLTTIEVEEIPEITLPPVEDIPTPKPPTPDKPTPVPVVPPKPEPVVDKPVSKPTPPKPAIVDFSQFKQQHNIPNKPTKPSPPRPTVVAPRINVPTDSPLLSQLPPPSASPTTTVSKDFMARYQRALEQHLQNQWNKEISSGSVGLSAIVSFQIDLRGRISGARIVNSSGDPDFDKAALNTFLKVRSFTAPPNKTTQRFSITLRGT